MKFKSDQNLQTALELTRRCLIDDREMPVKVEAAIALQVLISNQEKGKWFVCHRYRYITVKQNSRNWLDKVCESTWGFLFLYPTYLPV